MNRYVLVGTVYKTGYQVALQILETEESMPTTLPEGVSDAWWYDITGYTTDHLGWKVFQLDEEGLLFVEPTNDDYLKITTARMQERFDVAFRWLMFNPSQYKADLGIATPVEVTALIDYKRYCIAVSEVKNQPGYPSAINWPIAPF
ncbi:tail fiber assembly protein [Pseudomonas sp. McL0111]|uniref:tail fiber assembly protein n=1 Tax=Pseudomonas sp. McL0111 TaxID=3457357 RepID=UPI00403ECB0F